MEVIEVKEVDENLLDQIKDIIIATVKDLEEWENVPQAFLTQIIEKGRVLYER